MSDSITHLEQKGISKVSASGSSSSERIARPSPNIRSGLSTNIIRFMIHADIIKVIISYTWNPRKIFRILFSLIALRRSILGNKKVNKVSKVDGRYFWDLYAPGYPSKAFKEYISGEINRIYPLRKDANRFTNVFVSVTNKCPMQCKHCFEGESLNTGDKHTLENTKQVIAVFQQKGTAQIQLTGGEPLVKLTNVLEILKTAEPGTDFWVLTSGYNLTLNNAKLLKDAGLVGVAISVDHFVPSLHNEFRRTSDSFERAALAIKHARSVDLVVALSICTTKEFVTESNLMSYALMAKEMGVSFVQLLEPRATGNFKNQDVSLSREQEIILESFYLKMNSHKHFVDFPIITYHGYHLRKIGCFAAGDRNVYVSADGYLQACPFCNEKAGYVLAGDLDDTLANMAIKGCSAFKSAHYEISTSDSRK
jgi:MoaA/NifB/PqqE/SkfB family radical SAM enzyme